MRIVSKFKDYYDFVVSEPDNKKIFIRDTKQVVYRKEEHEKSQDTTFLSPINFLEHRNRRGEEMCVFENGHIGSIAFCDKLRLYLLYNHLIYWHFEDIPEDVLKKIKPKKHRWFDWEKRKDIDDYRRFSWYRDPLKDMFIYQNLGWVMDNHTKLPKPTDLNKLLNSPIVWMKDGLYNHPVINPKLSELGFNRVLSPSEAYQEIYNWIPYNEPEVPKSPDDMSRYEAKGFDKKTSFRPNMK